MCNLFIHESSVYVHYVYVPLHGKGLHLLDTVYLRGPSIELVDVAGMCWRGPHVRDTVPMKGLGS